MNREIKFRAVNDRWGEMIFFDLYSVPVLPEGTIVMQYTGIKDSNKKEIYEGDVVRHSEGVAVVVFNSGYFTLGIADDRLPNPEYGGPWDDANLGVDPVRIIGNVFHNPEYIFTECLKIKE